MKQIKQKLILLLSANSLFATSLVTITINNNYFEVNDHSAVGFHITVKSSNRNLVNSIKSWNHDSHYLYDTVNTNSVPLNINFERYDQIISNDWIESKTKNENIINDKGYKQLAKFIEDNKSNFKNAAGFLASNAYGHTFNEKSSNLILQYHQSIAKSIDEGLFATRYEASNVDTLMTVPIICNQLLVFKMLNLQLVLRHFQLVTLMILKIVLVMKCLFFMFIPLLPNQD